MAMTMGSLFDGAGTMPFAGSLCGIETLWSSEIEKFPLAVTAKRFPRVKQLGDITKIDGSKIEPVDIVTFGSPCQDLSIAGRREGLKGERSGLFMEAVRIIKEMRHETERRADEPIRPRYAVWENVPGAYSSNGGEDFRAVLEELCRVVDPGVHVPRPAGGRWKPAGAIVGAGFSVAWRTLDAKHWGVPQRRRRVWLVADFGGQRAPEILFEREGLQRSFKPSRETWEALRRNLEESVGATDSSMVDDRLSDTDGGAVERVDACENHAQDGRYKLTEKVPTLSSKMGQGGDNVPYTLYTYVGNSSGDEVAGTIDASYYKGTGSRSGNEREFVAIALDRSAYNQGKNAKYDMGVDPEGIAFTVTAKGPGAVCCGETQYVVRRLTPLECCRLQGMPDWWCADVPHADTPEYKMWGNGMALPNALYIMQGFAERAEKEVEI